MTLLEYHCRLLLRAYPATYRRDRGEEIIGTLLEATPEGRAWPLARDVAGLAVGGLRARAALNGQRATAENMRVAVLTGVSAYLAFAAASGLVFAVTTWITPSQGSSAFPAPWVQTLVTAVAVLAVAAVWLIGKPLLRLTAITAAVVAWSLAFPGGRNDLAALVSLAMLGVGGARPGWRWGWPVALAALCPVARYLHLLSPLAGGNYYLLVYVIGVASLLWAVIDARPAVATTVFLLGLWLPPVFIATQEIPLIVLTAVLAVMAWWLHRQSASVTARRLPLRPSGTASTPAEIAHGQDAGQPDGEDRVSPLERRCRLLLRAAAHVDRGAAAAAGVDRPPDHPHLVRRRPARRLVSRRASATPIPGRFVSVL